MNSLNNFLKSTMFGEVGAEGDGALQRKMHSVCLYVLLQFVIRILKEPSMRFYDLSLHFVCKYLVNMMAVYFMLRIKILLYTMIRTIYLNVVKTNM